MNLKELAQSILAFLKGIVPQPVSQFFRELNAGERTVLFALLASAATLGFFIGRHRRVLSDGYRLFGLRLRPFQNRGEALVSRVLLSHFRAPDYHLMNHVTMRMDDGTTQIDHVLVSRFGVFVIETKDFNGWVFGNATDKTWTQVHFRRKSKFQNPILQNYRHVCAVRGLLDFLPPETVKSVVVFSGDAEFKTAVPQGVLPVDDLAGFLRSQTEEVMSLNRLQFCVGRLETARLAITGETDVEHIQSLARRFGDGAE